MKLGPVEDQSAYIEAVDASIGVRLPRSYLAQGRSTGLTSGNTLVGAFTVITRPAFRSLMQLPNRTFIETAVRGLNGRVVEANGLFLQPEVRDPRTIIAFWSALVLELRRVDATFVLFSYAADSKKLHRFYAPVKPFALYVGPVRTLEGMSGPDVERVSLTSVSNIAATITSRAWLDRRIATRNEVSP